MKAVRAREFGGPERLAVEDVPDLQPGPGQVLVRIHAAGVNPADTYMLSGTYAIKPALPYTPGFDGAGVVLGIGTGVNHFATGDRVYVARSVTGTYAEQALCLEAQVHPLSDKLSFAQGAAIGVPYATAYRALFQIARVVPGETMLIHGASGGVGVAGLQLGRAADLTLIGTAGTDRGQALIREQGAHHVLDHHASDFAEQISQLTNGRGVDVILEMLANKNLGKDLTLLARKGRVVVIGNRGTVEINARDAMSRDSSILGMMLFNASEQEMVSIHSGLVNAIEAGTVRPIINQEMPLADAGRAHQAVMQSGAYGKIVLIP